MTLSERERDVLREMATGKADREIGRALSISWKTVKTHRVRIFPKINVTNRTQAALWWQKYGGENEARVGMDGDRAGGWPAAGSDPEWFC